VLEVAAKKESTEVIRLLLGRRRSEIKITEKVLVAAAEGRDREAGAMRLLLNERGSEVRITEKVLVAAAESLFSGVGVMRLLLDERGSEVKTTRRVVNAVMEHQNHEIRKELMKLLLNPPGGEFEVTDYTVTLIAGSFGKVEMGLLLGRWGSKVNITEKVLEAAAGNEINGAGVMKLLLDRRETEAMITEKVVNAAAGNKGCGIKVIKVLLNRLGSKVKITEESIKAASDPVLRTFLLVLTGNINTQDLDSFEIFEPYFCRYRMEGEWWYIMAKYRK
jgi:hypothetical protein